MSAGRDTRRLKERSRSSRAVLPLNKLVGSPPWSTEREFLEILRTLRPERWLSAPKGIMVRDVLVVEAFDAPECTRDTAADRTGDLISGELLPD